MTAKQGYWIKDRNTGTFGLVEGAEQRDLWVGVRGWDEADEPAPTDKVWLHHAETGGRCAMTREAADGLWAGIGWAYSAPPEPADPTRDPALVDQPTQTPPAPAPRQAAEDTTATVKEKARG